MFIIVNIKLKTQKQGFWLKFTHVSWKKHKVRKKSSRMSTTNFFWWSKYFCSLVEQNSFIFFIFFDQCVDFFWTQYSFVLIDFMWKKKHEAIEIFFFFDAFSCLFVSFHLEIWWHNHVNRPVQFICPALPLKTKNIFYYDFLIFFFFSICARSPIFIKSRIMLLFVLVYVSMILWSWVSRLL